MGSKPEDIGTTFEKISVWGTAVEQKLDASDALKVLHDLCQDDINLVSDSLLLAEAYQQNIHLPKAALANLSQNDPSHPLQRIARIQVLRELLGIENNIVSSEGLPSAAL